MRTRRFSGLGTRASEHTELFLVTYFGLYTFLQENMHIKRDQIFCSKFFICINNKM